MVMDRRQVGRVAAQLIAQYRAEKPRLDTIAAYMRDEVNDIYVPRAATAEYRRLVDQSRFNVLPLVVDSLAQALFMDGFRPRRSEDNAAIWDDVWQPNRMDARQATIYRSAITYGYSYALVLPGEMSGKDTAVITPYSPRHLTAIYDDPLNDEWPRYAMVCPKPLDAPMKPYGDPLAEPSMRDGVRVTIYDDQARYQLMRRDNGWAIVGDAEEHGLGVCPVVRYLESFSDEELPPGKVWPLLPAQRQLNQTTFGLLMAQQYAAFKQRWVTGMAIPEDDQGRPVEPWNAAVNRVWHAESVDTKFGEFSETDLRPYLESRDKAQLFVASRSKIPPHNMVVGSGISNISAEALAALEAGHRQDVAEHQSVFGEGNEQTLRLAGLASGNREAWEDRSSEAAWRDTTPRSLSQLFDAWGKGVQMMGVPEEGAWRHLPISDQEYERWRQLRQERDAVAALDRLVNGDQGGRRAEPGRAPADTGTPG